MNPFPTNPNFIAVHIGHSFTHSLLAHMSPPHNWVGGLLAGHIVRGALQRAGVLVSAECNFYGPLTDCVLFAEVSDAAAATETIKAELDAIPLHDIYQIGMRQGGQWRAVHPNPAARVDWLFDTDRIAAAHEDFKAAGREWCAQVDAICRSWRQKLATLPAAEMADLSTQIAQLEASTQMVRSHVAPQLPDEEGNAS